MNRRRFCFSLLALPGVASLAEGAWSQECAPLPADSSGRVRFVLDDPLEHPFYWWPRTLLEYPVKFATPVALERMELVRVDSGERIEVQFSAVEGDASGARAATVHFFSDLPSGGQREFLLGPTTADAPAVAIEEPQVREQREGRTIVLDSGVLRVRIPASQDVAGNVPGPVMQLARRTDASAWSGWIGSSTLRMSGDTVRRIVTRRLASGPLFVTYEIAYEMKGGSVYRATVQCEAGCEFVRLREDIASLRPDVRGEVTTTWTGFHGTHRQAPNHPFPISDVVRPYESYAWEKLDAPWTYEPLELAPGELPFHLGVYERAPGNFRTATWSNFWNEVSGDALAVFIDDVKGWQDHEYAYEVESPLLEVRYYVREGKFYWNWPLARGSRSTCIAFYDHAKDKEAMQRMERASKTVRQDGMSYQVPLAYSSHALFLENRYGTLDLNRVKDWELRYAAAAKQGPPLFTANSIDNPAVLAQEVLGGDYVCTLPISGTRQMCGHGPLPGRNIVNFSPVPSRRILSFWLEGYSRCRATMTERQHQRLTAIFLLMAYVHAGEEFMPLVPMLAGHPNFLADVKANPPAMAFLFPEHPEAATWADVWQKSIELNTRFNTRPAVGAWDARGGRWTENLGTYVWAFLRPSVRVSYMLKQHDGVERLATPQLAEMAEWLVNALSAPFDGETPQAYARLHDLEGGHAWGIVAPGMGPHRVHPPQGAHAERRIPPRSMWYLGRCLQQYAPLAAEHAMWAARPTNQDMETGLGAVEPWDAMYRQPDNRGTNPHLRSSKFTGYGITLRAAVDTPDEVSLHLQQIDQGPNYRWGVPGEGGCGVIYYFAGGKAWSMNAVEDAGDRVSEDTDFCTNFGVYKDGQYRSVGMNVLSRPMYSLGAGQYAEIVPRMGANAYAAPEYVGRGVLLAGHQYFVLYDRVANESLIHRLSWFVRKGDAFPTLLRLRGAEGHRETQMTELETEATSGRWYDGRGDSLVVVSHRTDLQAKETEFGCVVQVDGAQDLVFQNHRPVLYQKGGVEFAGTAGWIRTKSDRTEFALFHGTRIAVDGVAFETEDTDLGIGGVIAAGAPLRGHIYASRAATLKIDTPMLQVDVLLYFNGLPAKVQRQGTSLVVTVEQGQHEWELTSSRPQPAPTAVQRTEMIDGGARVFLRPSVAATSYRVELSEDNGATWIKALEQNGTEVVLRGLPERKLHVRAIACHTDIESEPCDEYPLYVTKWPPHPPDGLRAELVEGAASVSWGEVLGVTEYRLYARAPGEDDFHIVYRGLERSYTDRRAEIHACAAKPEDSTNDGVGFVTYCVTACHGLGESERSRHEDTNPRSWRNWDPKPGERFRRVYSFDPETPPAASEFPRYYPE